MPRTGRTEEILATQIVRGRARIHHKNLVLFELYIPFGYHPQLCQLRVILFAAGALILLVISTVVWEVERCSRKERSEHKVCNRHD